MSTVVIIPALNESKHIAKIITGAKQFGQVVVVDDGSVDNTYKLAKEAGAIIISHAKNMGYGKSILDGFKYAKENNYQTLITLDGDGQHEVNEIPNFLKALQSSDLVIGNRFLSNSNTPTYRKLGIKTISKLNGVEDSQCGFRAYNKQAINIIADNLCEKGMGASIEILKIARAHNLKISEIPCIIIYGQTKHSKNPLSHGSDLLLSFARWTIWEKPSHTLFPLGLLFLFSTVIAGAQTLNLYIKFHEIILSWTILTGFLLITTLYIFNAFIFIICFKNWRNTA